MDKRSLDKFSDDHVKAIDETDSSIQKWKKFQDDYEALRVRLATLPDKVSYDIMVPFTSLAFMPGRLVHTNELLVLLGDNWFAERSAKEAAEIVDRRLKVVRETLSGLEKQKMMLASRHEFTKSLRAAAAGGNEFEIKEEYDEQKERAWREEHRQRVAASKKAQSTTDKPTGAATAGRKAAGAARQEAGRSAASGGGCVDHASVFARLAELDLQERKRRELLSLNKSAANASSARASTHASTPATATTAGVDDDDDAASVDPDASSGRPLGHAESEVSDADTAAKKRVTFFDELQSRKSSDTSQTGTDTSSEDSTEAYSEAEDDEKEEGGEDEEAGKEKSFCEDDKDTKFSGEYRHRTLQGSYSNTTIFFTHSKPTEEVLSTEEAGAKKCIPTDNFLASVQSPADVFKLVPGSDQGRLVAMQHHLLPTVGTISKAKSKELKSILKHGVGDADDSGGIIVQQPLSVQSTTNMAVKPASFLTTSAAVPAFGNHVIEREPSSLPSIGPTSESVQCSGPQRPMSKFKAQQQRLHR